MSKAIVVDHVTKEFQLGTLKSFKQTLADTGRRLLRRPVESRTLFKALDDVHFSVEPGEVVGIIGHNGAGKSTLLKMLAGVATPTHGKVSVKGRIAPLIEVGAGFVPDFTGRENVYLNGSILGMSRKEIDAKFEEIVEFAEMARFIDTPVKRYSSGMQVKLAFSLATSVESDVIIIDEVLAVGDIAFQRKSLKRMEELINTEHRTVVIVGHNVRQFERICSRMLLLRQGRVEIDGAPGEVSKRFIDETTQSQYNNLAAQGDSIKPTHDSGDLEVVGMEVQGTGQKNGAAVCSLFEAVEVEVLIKARHEIRNVEINLGMHNPEMLFLLKAGNALISQKIDLAGGMNTLKVRIPNVSLTPGTYGVGMTVTDWARRPLWAGTSLRWLLVETTPELAARLPASTLSFTHAEFSLVPDSAGSASPPATTRAAG